MKKRLGAILIIMLVLMTTACGNSNSEEEPNGADSQMADDTENNSVILPSPDKIIAVSLEHDGTVTNYDDKEWVGEFINILMDMDITDELSVQDMPDIDDYTKIDIVCNDGTISTLFYYEKDGVSYVEQPYQGIYEPAPALGYYIESLLGGLTVDYPAMLMVDGQLYSGGGTVLTASLPLEADGQIISTCNGVPIKDCQSNFGSGYSYKYGADDTINVLLDDNEWHIFVLVDVERTIDMDSLSKQERMEVDPNYIPDNERPAKPIEGAPTNVSSPIDGVTMEVTECSDTSVTVKITNDTDKDIECGDDFYLAVQDEESGEWRELDTIIDNSIFNAVAYMIKKDHPYEMDINFEWLYGKLEQGRYHIVKTITDFRGSGDYTDYIYMAEFTVN